MSMSCCGAPCAGRRSWPRCKTSLPQQAELKRTAGCRERLAADAQAAWQAMGTQRWADPDEDDDEEKR